MTDIFVPLSQYIRDSVAYARQCYYRRGQTRERAGSPGVTCRAPGSLYTGGRLVRCTVGSGWSRMEDVVVKGLWGFKCCNKHVMEKWLKSNYSSYASGDNFESS